MIIRRVEPKRYLKQRILATIIDYGIFFIVTVIYCVSLGTESSEGVYSVYGLLALPIPILWFIYFVVLEAVNQASPGHDICKLVVVKTDGGKIGFTDAIKRRILDIVDIFFYGIPALICICNTPKFQRIGDLFADTIVVKRTDIVETEVSFR